MVILGSLDLWAGVRGLQEIPDPLTVVTKTLYMCVFLGREPIVLKEVQGPKKVRDVFIKWELE